MSNTHTDTDDRDSIGLSETETTLRDVLLSHRGKSNAISSTDLADAAGIPETNGNPTTRFAIRNLIKRTGLPVAACPTGYFLISSNSELREYVSRLEQRKRGIDARIELVTDAYESDDTQMTLTDVNSPSEEADE